MPDPALERDAVRLFEELLELPVEGREAWLDKATADRPELRARIEALREADRRAAMRTGAGSEQLAPEPDPPERIGAYRLAGLIGRGGMGSVYRGERATGDFAHVVAVKLIRPGLLSEALVERFHRERALLARLSHPAIARLYDGGEIDGAPYFVMELVEGLPLLQWIEDRQPDRAARVRLFGEICTAVGFAHGHLIVHRDLTPSNVLVTGEGQVKLIDFGIARPADAGSDEGAPSIAGLSLTPGYAAPERMTSASVTTAADIYSLGRLLAKLLPPDREVSAIVAKATAADPAARYATAEALGADVEAWHRGLPVAACGGGRRHRLAKFLRRNRLPVAAAALGLALLVGALVVTLLANAGAQAARVEAERRFDETRGIAKALLFDSFDEVSRVPGSTKARERLARTGLRYLEALSKDANAPLDVRIEAGLGYLRLAQVVGGGQASQLGRFADANALLEKADAILSAAYRAHPESAPARRALAALRAEQAGANLYNNNAVEPARAQAQEAQRLLAGEAMASAEAARIHASAVQAEGDSFAWNDDYAPARDAHLRAEKFLASLPPALRADEGVRSVRAANLRLLGEAHHKLKEAEPARRALAAAIALNRTLVAAAPDDPRRIRALAISQWRAAVVHRTNMRDEAARTAIAEAVANAARLRDRDPSDAGSLHLFAIAAEVQAQILMDLGRDAESYAVSEQVIAAHRRLVALAGDAPGALRSMASALRTTGGNHYNGKDYAGACTAWRQAHGILAGLQKRGALSESDRKNGLAEMTDYLGRACDPPNAGLGPSI